MSDYYQDEYYEVARTGKLQQYYTLYHHINCGIPGFWNQNTYRYVKNLSYDLDKALIEAKRIAGDGIAVEHVESPQAEYDRFSAFNLKWLNGKNCYYAFPNQDFWDAWRANKKLLKDVGFWVSRSAKGFMVFCRLKAAKELDFTKLPQLKTDYPIIDTGAEGIKKIVTGKLLSVRHVYHKKIENEQSKCTFQLKNGYVIEGPLPRGVDETGIGKIFSFKCLLEHKCHGSGYFKNPGKAVQK